MAAINLEKPDRVPVRLNMGFWPAKSGGLTTYEAMSDGPRAMKAWKDFNLKFQPDASVDPLHNTVPGRHVRGARVQPVLVAGPRGVGVGQLPVQRERVDGPGRLRAAHLRPDRLSCCRTYLPRTVGAFAGFGGLSSFFDFIELPFVFGQALGWGSDEMVAGLEKLSAAARAVNEWAQGRVPGDG